jgi:hypothetical protein
VPSTAPMILLSSKPSILAALPPDFARRIALPEVAQPV